MEEWSCDGHTIVIGGLVALSVLSVFVVPACYVKRWLYDGYTVVKQWSYDGHTIVAYGLGLGICILGLGICGLGLVTLNFSTFADS